MKTNTLRSFVALGVLALSCTAAEAQLLGVHSIGVVGSLLGNLGHGALSGNLAGLGQGALGASGNNLGQGSLNGLGTGALAGSLNGLGSIGSIGAGTSNVNALNGNTHSLSIGGLAGLP